jgi:hypothetical protein
MFGQPEKELLKYGALAAFTSTYETGVSALRITNPRGEIIVLPYQGQQIWSAKFDGRELTMRSMFDQPNPTQHYLQNYGGFLLHCGFTSMGVPGPGDTHPLHGELPNALYRDVFIEAGQDEKGNYLCIGGKYKHTVAFNVNYLAEPRLTIRENSALVNAKMRFTNLKNSPMTYMYLAHVNFRPVDFSRLLYSAPCTPDYVRVRTSIPSHVHPLPGFTDFLAELQQHPKMHHLLTPELKFDPEVVFYIDYLTDPQGWAHSMQIHPDGSADYIRHRPDQLDKGVRWICRTADQDALGLVLPATAEPEGYLAEQAKGNLRTLQGGESFFFEIDMGSLNPEEAQSISRLVETIVNA